MFDASGRRLQSQRRLVQTGDPAFASIERFDPTQLRCEVLRRFALETSRAAAAERAATATVAAAAAAASATTRGASAGEAATGNQNQGDGASANATSSPTATAAGSSSDAPASSSWASARRVLTSMFRGGSSDGHNSSSSASAANSTPRSNTDAPVAGCGSESNAIHRETGLSGTWFYEKEGDGSGSYTLTAIGTEYRYEEKHTDGQKCCGLLIREDRWYKGGLFKGTAGQPLAFVRLRLENDRIVTNFWERSLENWGADIIASRQPQVRKSWLAPLRAARLFVREMLQALAEQIKMSTFLAFPADSLFRDPCVEELYQRHHMQQWAPRIDWSVMAALQMLIWDVAANPLYRIFLVIRFYSAFAILVLVHRAVFLAMRGRPRRWRTSRGVILCGFLLGRGIVCHPLLAGAFPDEAAQSQAARSVQVASSLIGLGMTNLSAVLALQLHTLDTLLLCVAHGLACIVWAVLALQIPSGDAWHTLVAGHSLVACVCVWQQHEQERFERRAFEQELLMERGMLLRTSDCLVRQGAQADFAIGMRILHRARRVERLVF